MRLLPAWFRRLAVQAEELPGGILRYWPEGADRARPSFALKDGFLDALAPVPAGGPAPSFTRSIFGTLRARLDLPADWDLYGTGEAAGALRRNGTRVVAWNFDAFRYDSSSRELYQSHPWVLAVSKDGSSLGILADTTFRVAIQLKQGVTFVTEGPAFPVYLLPGSTPQEVLGKLAALTGTMPLPPRWALGYQQSRFSYAPDSVARRIAGQFRKRRIPADALWFDIDYMDRFKIFTFDPQSFPDPARLNAELRAAGFHSIWMIDPGVKVERGYPVYEQGSRLDAWVRTAEGKVFEGMVWPGACVFPDFTREDVRNWWASLYGPFLDAGVDGVWNDMNEPTVFRTETKTMPGDNRHEGMGGGTHARFHNVYGMLMAMATRQGLRRARPGLRPFVLTRANFIGGQRYAAAWTGDNTSNWEHVSLSIPMALNLGLSGQPFAGPDIGGFLGNCPPDMYARWLGIGALLPFCRAHADKGSNAKEPWSFGMSVEATCRRAIERRYRLLPYLYTVFEQAAGTGLPVVRPVFFADPGDPSLRAEDASFLLGDDLLVQAQPRESRAHVHALPKGDWKELSFEAARDPDLPVLRLRPGALIPTGPVIQHTGEPVTRLQLYANLDANGEAVGWLYEDEGDGYGYLEGVYSRRKLRARRSGSTVLVQVEERSGSFQGVDAWDLIVLGGG